MIDRPSRILLLEDEESDRLFITKAFERGNLDHEVTECTTGEEALAHIDACYDRDCLPDLILADLSLPGMNGRDVIELIRANQNYSSLIVIVLTSSSYHREISKVYAAGANAFVTKPARLSDLDKLVQLIEDFWLTAAHRPYI